MRFRRWALWFVSIFAALYVYFATLHPHEKVPDHPFFTLRGPWAIAHRGGRALWPENTMLAFENAVRIGVDVLDMDLRSTLDGDIVVIHDGTVDRTTNGTGAVSSMTLAELQKLDAGYRFAAAEGEFPYRGRGVQIPRFEDVLARFEGKRVNVEMKEFTPELAVKLCGMITERSATGKILVGSFAQDAMTAFRESCPSVATSATLRESLVLYQLQRMYLGNIYRGPAVALQIPEAIRGRSVVDADLLGIAARFNLQVQVWTVNEEADMKRLLDLGIQGIFTDYPDRLLRLMGRTKPETQ